MPLALVKVQNLVWAQKKRLFDCLLHFVMRAERGLVREAIADEQ